jgi:hypothetical protein
LFISAPFAFATVLPPVNPGDELFTDLEAGRAATPMTEASEVFLTLCSMKLTGGGVEMRSACGTITSQKRWLG